MCLYFPIFWIKSKFEFYKLSNLSNINFQTKTGKSIPLNLKISKKGKEICLSSISTKNSKRAKSLFPFQQKIAFVSALKQRYKKLVWIPSQLKLDIYGIAAIYARKQRYNRLVPSLTKNSICQCVQTAKTLAPISTKKNICLCAQAAL